VTVSNIHHDVVNIHHGVSNTHAIVSDIHRNILQSHGGTDGQHRAVGDTHAPRHRRTNVYNLPDPKKVSDLDYCRVQHLILASSALGESPPPAPRVFYGRDELIEKIVDFAEHLTPVALIGAGGIGKTSIALTVLHDDRIKQRFGDCRRFIRCDKFPASPTHFLRRLSNVIGAGIENPEDLTPLRPFLSSNEMFIVLDNAEPMLDPQGADAQEIYDVVDELSQLSNVSLCITSRISTVPPGCEWVDVPTLSMEAACDTFYRIYKHGERSVLTSNILEQLEFHPLSITLLATVAHHNKWNAARLASEWDERRTDMLQTEHSKSLGTTIELSLSSRMFRELGPEARDLLGVIAFFPQGVDEKNIDWLFSTIPGRKNIFDKFCVLSLTYRSDDFIMMLAPLRDHLRPKDPMSSPLLRMTKDHYFGRLSVDAAPDKPGFGEARWIMSEDVNVEHLLDVFTTLDMKSNEIWTICIHFMNHLYWHKPRLTILGPKIEKLPDDHPSKPRCLLQLSRLFDRVGNDVERKRILTGASRLWREQGDDGQLARTLLNLSDANRLLGNHKEGIRQVEEALEICKRLGDTAEQARCLNDLARLLHDDKQLDAAEKAASRAIGLLEKGNQSLACDLHCVLGKIYRSKGERGKAIHHLETALGIASSLNQHDAQFWTNHALAELFFDEGRFDDASAHVQRAKSHAVNDAYLLGRAMELQAGFWYQQCRLHEAKAEVLHAADVYGKVGAAKDVEDCRKLLRRIETAINDGEPPEMVLIPTRTDFLFSVNRVKISTGHPFPIPPSLMGLSTNTQFLLFSARKLVDLFPEIHILRDVSYTHVHSTNVILIHSGAAKVAKKLISSAHAVRARL